MEINEKIIRITGSACIDKELEFAHDYKLAIECQCYSIEDKDQHNGTLNRTYKLRLLGETYINDAGKCLIKGKSKAENSPSQRLYKSFHVLWNCKHTGTDEDFQKYYEEKMNEIIKKVQKMIP